MMDWGLRLATRAALAGILLAAITSSAAAQTVRERYAALLERQEQAVALLASTAADAPSAEQERVVHHARAVIAGYDALARRFRASGYADNALWNAATIADALFARFGRERDRLSADRYAAQLLADYPTSSLVRDARRRQSASPAARPSEAAERVSNAAEDALALPAPSSPRPAVLRGIDRTIMEETVRVTLELDREVVYHEERLSGPARLFFDLQDVQTAPDLRDAVLRYTDDAVRLIRIGRHPNSIVRVVLDLEGVKRYSVFTLYNPFRLVVDCEPVTPTSVAAKKASAPGKLDPVVVPFGTVGVVGPDDPSTPVTAAPPSSRARTESEETTPAGPLPSTATANATPAPLTPRANRAGGYSLSRQLGLGVTRVVIDPGHGGHDPGAQGKGLNEAELTLDVALRLEQLLRQEGLEVILTRRADVFIPLEARTAMANREGADLFLSIHANASRNAMASGVETYYLSFASTPEAEAVAARENSSSTGGMHNLPDIIKAIALNNKLDESRDFAGMVQEALVSRLRRSNKDVRNLGVKKAPFVVLIGAGMPSVLAEISFLTNKQELALLKSPAYKQRVAEALHAAVMRYRRSLKGQGQIAEQ